MKYTTIHELIQDSLGLLPDNHILIQQSTKHLTVVEVKTKSELISAWIRSENIEKGTQIALLMNDRMELITSILGILEVACVFVPLESSYPADTIKEMLQTAKIELILTDDYYDKFDEVFHQLNIKVVNIRTWQFTAPDPCSDEVYYPSYHRLYYPEDPIYVYFTSGTSNKPKAVLGQNQGLTHFIEWEAKNAGYLKAKVSQLTSPCHDPFLRDVFVAIRLGGTICIPNNREMLLDGRKLLNWIRKSDINIIHCTPSLFNHMLLTLDKPLHFPALCYVYLAGEKVNPQYVKKWFQMTSGNVQLRNLYGPTETTLAKLCYDISMEDVNLQNIPIGKPIDGSEVLIFNEKMELCDFGETGEIYIRTIYRSLGYLYHEKLNQTVFVPNPFSEEPDDIIYKTGDLGRRLADGNIEFIGRIDKQVKVRGNRVELGYIEHLIMEMEQVRDCAMIFNDNDNSSGYIVAYIVTQIECTRGQVIEFLKKRVPEYMLPSYIVFMEELPLNNNMKIDTRALPDPRCVQVETITPATNEFESKLASIFESILNVNQISIKDSFFTLGGTSLDVMLLISKLYIEFQVEISMEDVFGSKSLEELAALIMERLGEEEDGTCNLEYMEKYSVEEYDRNLQDSFRYIFASGSNNQNSIDGFQPFNELFYKSCISNSLFSVINYYNADIMALFVNDIILYGSVKANDEPNKIEYYELEPMENILLSMGIGVNIYTEKQNIIHELIQSIDRQNPVIIGVDCFYEAIRPEFYKISSWPHNILVYGYDNERQEMKVLEHTGVNNLDYHEQKIRYLDLEFAYHNNIIKFYNFEKRRHYMEFYKISNYVKRDINVYFQQFRKNINKNLSKIISNLDNIPCIIDYLRKHTIDLEHIKISEMKVISLLDSIIEAKIAQGFMFHKFTACDISLRQGNEYIKDITKKWKLIRNVIYRTTLTQDYNMGSFHSAFSKLEEVYYNEKDFYNWFSKYGGV